LTSPEKLSDTGKVRDHLRMINTIAQDAAHVVHRLREFYRPRRETERFELVDVNTIIEQSIPLTEPKWKQQAQATGSHIEICRQLQSVPAIAADDAEIREVLTNLIFNAVDAMPSGGTLTISTRADGDHDILEVADTGVGMTDSAHGHCFEPFFSTKGDTGTGLGLAIVYGIVQRHRGSIGIESLPGHGTTFTVRLPAHHEQLTRPAEPKASAASKAGLRILIVEDEPMIRQIEAEYLTTEGHIVETAADGAEGLSKFHAGKFDLVLVDRAMPEINGDQLTKAIKELRPETPVVLVTGFSDILNGDGDEPHCRDMVLTKPFSQADLRLAVQKAVAA